MLCACLVALQALPAAEGLRVVAASAVRTFFTLVAVLLAPAVLGALRALISGGGGGAGYIVIASPDHADVKHTSIPLIEHYA